MADNIPFEIQVEIIKFLPVKSLIQFRSVSKTWKSLIDSSHFVAHYSFQRQHLLVKLADPSESKLKYFVIADDDTFPHHKVSVTLPLFANMLKYTNPIGSSHGLFCFYGRYSKRMRIGDTSRKFIAVIWNMSIRKAVAVALPRVGYETSMGFWVCHKTNDPKIIVIKKKKSISSFPWQAKIFTLSAGVWRRLNRNNIILRKSISFIGLVPVAVDGFLYWLGVDHKNLIKDGVFQNNLLIISFDTTTEEFREVNLPDRLAFQSDYDLSLSKLRESLVVLEHGLDFDLPGAFSNVWIMEDSVKKSSFKKLFTFNFLATRAIVLGFRMSGEPIIQSQQEDGEDLTSSKIAVYSNQINTLGMDGRGCIHFVYPYMETLLLLDQPNDTFCTKKEARKYLDDLVS